MSSVAVGARAEANLLFPMQTVLAIGILILLFFLPPEAWSPVWVLSHQLIQV